MRPQRVHRVIAPRQVRLAQRRVDFPVALVVQENRRPALAAFQLRYQVVLALGDIRRDPTSAKRADRIAVPFLVLRITHHPLMVASGH